jgi:hypothetical protein
MLPHKIYLSRAQTRSMSAYEPIGDPTGGAAYGEYNDPVTAAVVVGGSLIAADMQSGAASDAAGIQAAASDRSAAMQKAMFDIQNKQQTGYRAAGQGALSEIGKLGSGTYQTYDEAGNLVGTPQVGSGYLTKQFTPEDFAAGIDPGYAFRLKMGQDQAMRQANLGGGALSGNALTGLQDYTQGQASQEYGNAFNRFQTQRANIYNTLASIAGLGQTSLGQTGQMSTQAGANIGQAISNAGAAQAAGVVGSANALAGGLQSAGNTYALSNLLKGNQPQTFTDVGGWSGGGSGMVNVPGQGSMSIGDYFRT